MITPGIEVEFVKYRLKAAFLRKEKPPGAWQAGGGLSGRKVANLSN
jgi:hypothetical protein